MGLFGRSEPRPRGALSIRALILGIIIMPLTSLWVIEMEKVHGGPFPSTISLFANAVTILFLLVIFNSFIGRVFRKSWALTQAELFIVYTMAAIATSLAGHDMLPNLIMMIPHAAWYATKENRWTELFGGYLKDWTTISDRKVLEGFYYGNSSLYRTDVLQAWIGPTLWWTSFIFALGLIMVCVSILVRNLWVERERLTYPVIELPIQMTNPDGALWRNKLFWIGFLLAGSIDALNGLHYWYPWVPTFVLQDIDLASGITAKPWTGIGWMPMTFFPFAIGLGYLLPVDLLFSCWFFYLFFKMQGVATVASGLDQTIPNFPFVREQGYGGYLAITIILFFNGRKYLAEVIRRALGKESELDDSQEGLSYRLCLILILVSSIYLIWFLWRLGLSPHLGVLSVFMYFVISIVITRIRAELGPPVHDQHFSGPNELIPQTVGAANMSTSNLVGISWLFWFNRAYRSHPMPILAEGLKGGNIAQSSQRKFTIYLLIAIFLGTIGGFWAYLHLAYAYGIESKFAMSGFAWEPFNKLGEWLVGERKGPNIWANLFLTGGTAFGLILGAIRNQVYGFPFHPIGFAISGSWAMNLVWFPLFLAWVIKSNILRYGGLPQYKSLMPLFLGLILGQCFIGCFWSLAGLGFKIPYFSFWGA